METRVEPAVRRAWLLGRDHALVGRNGQDHAVALAGDRWAVGVVADGCGEREGSEVGARLSAIVAARAAAARLEVGAPLGSLAEEVGAAVLAGLRDVARAAAGQDRRALAAFAHEHLAATLWVVAAGPGGGLLFGWGDGLFRIGDRVHVVDEGGRPQYLVGAPGDAPPTPSAIVALAAGEGAVVATDGWDEAALLAAPRQGSSVALLRWMRLRQRAGSFTDDGAVADVSFAASPEGLATEDPGAGGLAAAGRRVAS